MKRRSTFNDSVRNLLTLLLLSMFLNVGIAQTTHVVDVTNNVFTPDVINISVGDEVQWTNSEGYHNVNGSTDTYPNNPESFGNEPSTGWTFSYTFDTPGTYDYQCDPHVGLGMVGQVIVEVPTFGLTLNFAGMTPHVGQDLWLRVENDDTNEEIYREMTIVQESFALNIPGLKEGGSYVVEFFADHNQNGYYDAPGDDHAWTIEITDVAGDVTENFTHNTEFTDIEWEHRAIINLSGMTPHVGQEIFFALIKSSNNEIVDRKSEVVSESFTVMLEELIPGMDYRIDFYSDHNDNGYYDAPGDDHAWRFEILNADGDEIIDFTHNTEFTDIEWQHRLKIDFMGMTPHVGQMMKLYLRDHANGETLDSVILEEISESEFDIEMYGIVPGSSYNIDFYADLNQNGSYDSPPTDHAWRIELLEAEGDETVEFSHNTEFTDIEESEGTEIHPTTQSVRFTIYPNPVTDILIIESASVLHSMQILSVNGAILRTYNEIDGNALTVNIDNLLPGLYFLQVQSTTGMNEVLKIVKK